MVPEPGYIYISEYRCKGGVYQRLWVDDAKTCEDACDNNTNCGAFTFRPYENGAGCQLMFDCDQGLEYNTSYYSAIKPTGRESVSKYASAGPETNQTATTRSGPQQDRTTGNGNSASQPVGFMYIDDFVCSGGWLATKWVPDFLTCQEECISSAQCTGFNFHPYQYSAECVLLKDCDALVQRENYTAARLRSSLRVTRN
eukprot:scaffold6242_cov45-Prasinocladus_malaysianus.AAC.1